MLRQELRAKLKSLARNARRAGPSLLVCAMRCWPCFITLILLGAGCAGASATPAPAPTPAPEASPAPALRLPKTFRPTAYEARLEIDPSRTTFDGSIDVHGNVAEPASELWLHGRHLAVRHAEARPDAGGGPVPLTITARGEDLLQVAASTALAPGAWTLRFDYGGDIDELDTSGAFKQTVEGKAYVYTQFEAVYARRVFPCVDEPDSKVPWQLTLDVPAGMTAVSNTRLAGTAALPSGGTRYEFERTKPLPSYLVAFGVGPFDVVEGPATRSGVPVRMVTLAGRSADAAYSVGTTARIVDLLEDWFGIPYPFDKLDLLTIPVTVGFGAMENAGLVTFAENLSLFEQKAPSWEKRHLWVVVAAHELAHQWFGNYVTTAWWDDIWLNEGFATWMESKIATRFEPGWHDELSDLDLEHRALDADRLASARQIREPIRTSDDIFNVFDDITYEKGATVLNMFERYVGPEVFQRGVREYLRARAYGNATSQDFVAAISAAAGKDLGPAFSSFLEQKGAPELGAELACGTGGAPVLRLSQRPFAARGALPADGGARWLLPTCVAYDRHGERAEACTLLADAGSSLPLPASACPRWVMPNVDGRGYYRHRYDAARLLPLRDVAWPQLTWTERRNVFFDVSGAVRWGGPGSGAGLPESERELALALPLVPKMLLRGNRFTIGDAVGFANALDPFVPEDLRPAFEAWLRSVFSPAARALGLAPRASDDLDAEASRVRLLDTAGFLGRDPELVREARQHAQGWRDLPQAIRGEALALAVDSDRELGLAVAAAVETEPDRARRGEMLRALARVRDPDRLAGALKLVNSPTLDLRESVWMLGRTSTEQTRRVAAAFFRANEATLMQRMPKDEVAAGAVLLARLFTGSCEASEREEARRYVTEKFAPLPGGKVAVEQLLEEMDQCIAARAQLEPQIRAWLGGKSASEKSAPR
jgi:peptidase M1-like protein/ERAP1-like protein